MKKITIASLLILVLSLSLLSACGGGGGGATLTQPTKAVVTLSTSVTGTIPPATTINSYNVTITLPAGVSVKSTVNPPETDANVVTASGKAAGASIIGVYTEATGTFPATVKLSVVKVDPITGAGFDPGEFCTVTCDIAAGHYPVASNFVQPTLDDATGIDITTSTVILTGQLSLTGTAVVQ
jgi:hypothetical protein